MLLIRCTRKLQKEMGLAAAVLATQVAGDGVLGSWHANLIYIKRRKCVLFVNDATRFNFIAVDIPRAQIRKIDECFRLHLSAVLADYGLPDRVREAVRAEASAIGYAGDTDKSVLGTLNDLAFHYKHLIGVHGGVHSVAVPGIIRQLNEMPMGPINWAYPIEALKTRLALSG